MHLRLHEQKHTIKDSKAALYWNQVSFSSGSDDADMDLSEQSKDWNSFLTKYMVMCFLRTSHHLIFVILANDSRFHYSRFSEITCVLEHY